MDVNKPVNTEKGTRNYQEIEYDIRWCNDILIWVAQNGEVVTEKVTIVYAFAQASNCQRISTPFYGICLDLKKSMKQEAITLVGKVHLTEVRKPPCFR